MILTQRLAELRMEARGHYPNATWLPGDEPPIGQAVMIKNDRGVIMGVWTGEHSQERDNVPSKCSSCGSPTTKEESGSLAYWWVIKTRFGNEVVWPPKLLPA